MAITYPRSMPSRRIERVEFELGRQEVIGGEQGGRVLSVELGPLHWRLKLSTTPPSEAEFDIWRAWLASLKGSSKLFYGRDMRRGRYPRAYVKTGFADLTRAGGGAFDGTASAIDLTDRQAPELSGLPAGFQVAAGDYVGFTYGADHGRTLHRFVESGTADVSGVLALTIEPEAPPFVPVDAVATFDGPTCLMMIAPGSVEISAEHKDRRVAFDAVQHYVTA